MMLLKRKILMKPSSNIHSINEFEKCKKYIRLTSNTLLILQTGYNMLFYSALSSEAVKDTDYISYGIRLPMSVPDTTQNWIWQ